MTKITRHEVVRSVKVMGETLMWKHELVPRDCPAQDKRETSLQEAKGLLYFYPQNCGRGQ